MPCTTRPTSGDVAVKMPRRVADHYIELRAVAAVRGVVTPGTDDP